MPDRSKARPTGRWGAWRKRLLALSRVAAAALAIATAAGFAADHFYAADLAAHFRPAYLWLATAAAVALFAVGSPRFAGVAATVAVVNATLVVPWYFGRDTEVPRGPRARVATVNVQLENTDHGALVDDLAARRVDVVALVEVDERWMEAIAPLRERLPHVVAEPRGDRFGIALLSRWPLEETRVVEMGATRRPTLVARVTPPDAPPFTVVATHAPPPASPDFLDERNRHLERLAELSREELDGRGVLLGDLNTTPWTPPYARLLEGSGLRDAREGFGVLGTWPAPVPTGLALPLDHVLVSADLRVVDVLAGAATGSDHRSLVTDLALP